VNSESDCVSRLQALEDRADLAELRALYCVFADQKRWDDLANLFTEDGWLRGRDEIKGRTVLRNYFEESEHRSDAAWHFSHNETTDLNGDEATGYSYFDAPRVKEGKAWVCAGYYDDRFRRVDGRWHFQGRILHYFYMGPLQPGWQVDALPAGLPH
jgi:hypothetical protein